MRAMRRRFLSAAATLLVSSSRPQCRRLSAPATAYVFHPRVQTMEADVQVVNGVFGEPGTRASEESVWKARDQGY